MKNLNKNIFFTVSIIEVTSIKKVINNLGPNENTKKYSVLGLIFI